MAFNPPVTGDPGPTYAAKITETFNYVKPLDGTTVTVYKSSGGVWPARPTTATNVTIIWVGAAPAPTVGGTGGAVSGVDLWVQDAL